jgi:CPA2 family monovalent cation:H+ antiporter-2
MVANAEFTAVMAEVGVTLLLFAVGLHFSPKALQAVWHVAVPGALVQIATGTLLGAALGHAALGLAAGAALVFGLALSISSTAVATRALEEAGRLGGHAGRLAVGWLVVQDLVVVLALVLLPALANGADNATLGMALLQTVGQLAAFMVAMLAGGKILLPRLLALVAATGSRELFPLAVAVVALGTAFGSSALFGVSPALGAFFAGVMLGESPQGHQAAADTMPLQRVFVALFFVSVGMQLDPFALLGAPFVAVGAVAAVLLGTGGAILLVLVALRVALPIAASVAGHMAQIGEFSFVLAELGIAQGVLPEAARGPILAAATCSIVLTPLSARLADALAVRLEGLRRFRIWQARRTGTRGFAPLPLGLADHTIVVGHGRVGRVLAAALARHGQDFVVIEADHHLAEALRRRRVPVVWGDAARPEVLKAARPETARMILLAVPEPFSSRRVLQLARAANPGILAAARAHDEADSAWLINEAGVGLVVMGEREVALGMASFALAQLDVPAAAAQGTVEALRADPAMAAGPEIAL